MVILFPKPVSESLTDRYMTPQEVNAAFHVCLERVDPTERKRDEASPTFWWRANLDLDN